MARINGQDKNTDMAKHEPDEGPSAVTNTSNLDVPECNTVHLKRQIGLFTATLMVVGNIIGTGIFISPKGVLKHTQNTGMSIVIWALCGVLSFMGALCYAELSTMIPKSGGEYAYLFAAFGSVPAFMFSWTTNFVIRPAGLAIMSISFADYAMAPFFEGTDCFPPVIALKILAIVCILFMGLVNTYSVKMSGYFINVLTVAKLIALAVIIVVGVMRMGQGYTEHIDPKTSFDGSSTNVFSYGVAFYQGLFAYDGWNALTYITEELVNPYRNTPIAILLGTVIVTTVYLLTNLSYLSVMSAEELLQSDAVAVTFASRTLGVMWWVIPLGVILSIFGATTCGLLFSGRLPYVAAREGHLPDILAMVHVNRYTPLTAITFVMTLVIILILPGSIDTLINYFSFVNWLIYGSATLALIWLRYKHPEWKRPIKIPIVIPVLVVFASLYLISAPIINDPSVEFLYAGIFIVAGLLAYFPFVHYKYRPPFMDRLTRFLQILFKVAPTGYKKM